MKKSGKFPIAIGRFINTWIKINETKNIDEIILHSDP